MFRWLSCSLGPIYLYTILHGDEKNVKTKEIIKHGVWQTNGAGIPGPPGLFVIADRNGSCIKPWITFQASAFFTASIMKAGSTFANWHGPGHAVDSHMPPSSVFFAIVAGQIAGAYFLKYQTSLTAGVVPHKTVNLADELGAHGGLESLAFLRAVVGVRFLPIKEADRTPILEVPEKAV